MTSPDASKSLLSPVEQERFVEDNYLKMDMFSRDADARNADAFNSRAHDAVAIMLDHGDDRDLEGDRPVDAPSEPTSTQSGSTVSLAGSRKSVAKLAPSEPIATS